MRRDFQTDLDLQFHKKVLFQRQTSIFQSLPDKVTQKAERVNHRISDLQEQSASLDLGRSKE